ncbi:MAG: hypothetical protein AB7O39_01080 [Flavobacteriaceae bacterium]
MTATAAIDAAVVQAACGSFRPIGWSRDDTAETIRQARAHNAAWEANCGRGRATVQELK